MLTFRRIVLLQHLFRDRWHISFHSQKLLKNQRRLAVWDIYRQAVHDVHVQNRSSKSAEIIGRSTVVWQWVPDWSWSFRRQRQRQSSSNIGDDMKGPAHRSPNCIRWNAVICPIAEILRKTASMRKISIKWDNQLLSYSQKQFLKWRPFAILNF